MPRAYPESVTMSRSASYAIALFLCVPLAVGAPAAAQSAPTITAEEALAQAEEAYGPPAPEKECAPQKGDEIVVCAEEEQDQSQFRVKSSSELEPESQEALDDGTPRAPDVAGPGIFTGPATVGGLCIPGLQKCPPPPALIIDVTALPQAPEGSDADKIAKGEMPAP